MTKKKLPTYIDGMSHAAELLSNLDEASRERIMKELAARDPSVAQKLQARVFSFDELLRLDSRTLQEVIRQVPSKKLALAFRGASEMVKNHFYACLSPRAAQTLREEVEHLGPQKKTEVEAAQREIVELVKQQLARK